MCQQATSGTMSRIVKVGVESMSTIDLGSIVVRSPLDSGKKSIADSKQTHISRCSRKD
jgi:hypothetical protein